MAKPSKRVHRNRNPKLNSGDKYTVSNDVELADVDGDGSEDLQMTHLTKRNGQAWVGIQITWYGIDPTIGETFAEMFKAELGTDIPIKNFGQLVKQWESLGKGTRKITDVGRIMAEGLGEAAD